MTLVILLQLITKATFLVLLYILCSVSISVSGVVIIHRLNRIHIHILAPQ